jgi:hypothetical protein
VKMPLICAECMRENVSTASFIVAADVQDSNLYFVKCPKGHDSYVILQEQKFELLFAIGACALLDGYYREAVTSFTSSLERFHEFYVWAALLQNGYADSDIEVMWKPLSRQSERQLGAYLALYMIENGTLPPILSSKNVEFRNDVIHRGKIPARAEALAYGECILETIKPALRNAKQKFPDGIQKQIGKHMLTAHKAAKEGSAVATSCMPTILSLSREESKETLEQQLVAIKKMWNWPVISAPDQS